MSEPIWEVASIPKPYAEWTDEERDAFDTGTLLVKYMSLDEIKNLYGDPISPADEVR